MTHVILKHERTGDELYITFPITDNKGYFSYFRAMRPNANWKPSQSWET